MGVLLFPIQNKWAFSMTPWKRIHRDRIWDTSLATLTESTLKSFKERALKFSWKHGNFLRIFPIFFFKEVFPSNPLHKTGGVCQQIPPCPTLHLLSSRFIVIPWSLKEKIMLSITSETMHLLFALLIIFLPFLHITSLCLLFLYHTLQGIFLAL